MYPVTRYAQQTVEQTTLARTRLAHQTHKTHRLVRIGNDLKSLIIDLYLAIMADLDELDGTTDVLRCVGHIDLAIIVLRLLEVLLELLLLWIRKRYVPQRLHLFICNSDIINKPPDKL